MAVLTRASLLCVFALASACSSSEPAVTDDAGSLPERAPADPTTPDAGGSVADAGSGDAAPAPPPDPCASVKAVCPKVTTTEGAGLTSIDRCAFPIAEAASFATYPALADAVGKIATPVTIADVLADLNRAATPSAAPGAPPGVDLAIKWDSEDDDVTTWIPQGITGSADASATGLVAGKRVVVVSWYYTPPAGSTYEKGVRLAIIDVTNRAAPKYRFALLVEPKGSVANPTYAPVVLHAGGIVWIGDRLYVAQTTRGFRVFDMSRLMRVATDLDEIGCTGATCRAGLYKYVVPQIGAYTVKADCDQLFSYVSLDRSTNPPSLLSGEYCSDTACAGPFAGRVFRFPLDASGKLPSGTSWPSEAFLFGQKQVQGAASRNGTYYLSSSAPAGGGGALYRVQGKKSATSKWLHSPEDLMVDEKNGLLWSISEEAGNRVVMGAKLASYPAP